MICLALRAHQRDTNSAEGEVRRARNLRIAPPSYPVGLDALAHVYGLRGVDH